MMDLSGTNALLERTWTRQRRVVINALFDGHQRRVRHALLDGLQVAK
jgi:hypothetical protein